MFETKVSLRQTIKRLESELEKERAINQLRERNGLQECRGIICKTCKHCVVYHDRYGNTYYIGCDLTTNCKSYEKMP